MEFAFENIMMVGEGSYTRAPVKAGIHEAILLYTTDASSMHVAW